jgi:hypothetical protein
MPVTSTDIVNEAIQLIGDNQPPVTGTAPDFDTSTAGKAAAQVYLPTIAAVMRQFSWDFSRSTAALVLSGNTAPYPWTLEYQYPAGAIEVWELSPLTEDDPNDPLPVNFVVANAIVNGVQQRVIQTSLVDAQAIFGNNPSPDTWDALFHQAAVRLLASTLAMAIGGKPDVAQSMLSSGAAFEGLGETRRN